MSEEILSLIIVGLVQFAAVAFFLGKLSQKVEGLTDLADRLDALSDRLDTLDVKIGRYLL